MIRSRLRARPTLERAEARLAPAAITVTNLLDDTLTGNGVSLREAVLSVNAGADLNADVAATGVYGSGDTITFGGAAGAGTIRVATAGDPTAGPSAFGIAAGRSLTILGSGQAIARDAAAAPDRLRLFFVPAGASLTLRDLVLSDGLARGGSGGGGGAGLGGAIYN